MSDALSAFGTLLKKGNGAEPEVFATVAEVGDIDGPGWETDDIETTNHSSPGGWKEYIAGLLDAGEVSFPINFIPGEATHDHETGLIADQLARVTRNWQIVWPTGAGDGVQFKGYVKNFNFSEPTEEELSAEITIKVTGAPIFLPVAP